MSGHHFASTIIREYDIRGIVGKNLGVQDALAIGRTLGEFFSVETSHIAVVGRDGRNTSPELAESLIYGLKLSGMIVMDIGLVATPMLYFANKVLESDVAIMVTGSHNAAEYNGFKIMINGKPFYGQQLKHLAERAKQGNWRTQNKNGHAIKTDMEEAYIKRILRDMKQLAKSGTNNNYVRRAAVKPLKVGWDPGNGAFGPTIKKLIPQLLGQHSLINETIDGTFPEHHPDPTVAENLQQLIKLVKDNQLDIGIAFDGDGDRIGLVDSKGRILWGDQILMLLAEAILPNCPPESPVIFDVKASDILVDQISRLGGKPVMAPTGHSIIKSKMAELNAPLAGEMSGHIFIAHHYYGYDDALYVALRILDYLMETGSKLSDFVDRLPASYNTPEIRIDVAETEKFKLIEKVGKALDHYDQNQINKQDGLRVRVDHGWWLIRASNTQPCLVVRCEGKTKEDLIKLCKEVQGLLSAEGVETSSLNQIIEQKL